MKPVIPIVIAGTPAAKRAIRKLSDRLAAMERLDSAPNRARAKRIFGRPLSPVDVVSRILSDVRTQGDPALFSYCRKIDGVALNRTSLRIASSERKAAYRRSSPALRAALKKAAARISEYQKRLMPKNVALESAHVGPPGVRTGLRWSPLQRVGIYIPGGTAAYPSSVLMNAIPAMVAGVKEIAIATPCAPDGAVSDGVLCACEILGLQEIYRMGGAQAIAALAYGTRSVKAVDKIAGPGNLFVMLAKRAVFGTVDIDMLAGPSEILIVADSSAKAGHVAADLLSQAEHDVLASCVLLTDSAKLAQSVALELERQLSDLPRRGIAAAALRDWGVVIITRNVAQSIALANQLAPEHLEIQTRNPRQWLPKLTTAGAIFVGPYATEPLGDYLAGPSHTLPTGGTARVFSGLSVYTFLRRSSVIDADAHGLHALAGSIDVLARAEGLEGHRRAVEIRRVK